MSDLEAPTASFIYGIEPHASTYKTQVEYWLPLIEKIQDKKGNTIVEKGLLKSDKSNKCIIFFSKEAILVSLFDGSKYVTVVFSLWSQTINKGEYHTYAKYTGKNIQWTANHNDFLLYGSPKSNKTPSNCKTAYYFMTLNTIETESQITEFNEKKVVTLIIKIQEDIHTETIKRLLTKLTSVKALIICGTCSCNFDDLEPIVSQSVAFVYCTDYTGNKGKSQTDGNFTTKTFFFCTNIEAANNKLILNQEEEKPKSINMEEFNKLLNPEYLNDFDNAETNGSISLDFGNNENPIISTLQDYSSSEADKFIFDTKTFVNDLPNEEGQDVLNGAIEALESLSKSGDSSSDTLPLDVSRNSVNQLSGIGLSGDDSNGQSDDSGLSVDSSSSDNSSDIARVIDGLRQLRIEELKQAACKVCGIKLAQ